MPPTANWSLRRALLARGVPRQFVPQTRLAVLTAYLVAVTLLFLLAREGLRLAGAAEGAVAFAGFWFQALRLVAALLLFALLVRWIRQRFLWSLRRRLFMTYFFIGVIPIVLVVLMALLAAYLFAGQFASFIASSELDHRLQQMDTANHIVARELAGSGQNAAALERRARELLAAGELMPNARIAVWLGDRKLAAQEGAPADRAAWAKETLRVVAVDGGEPFLRVVHYDDLPAGRVAVVSSMPLAPSVTGGLAKTLGEVRVFLPDFTTENQDWDLDQGGQQDPNRLRLSVNEQRGPQAKIITSDEMERAGRGPAAVAGTLPPPARTGDREITFGAPYEMVEWATGKKATGVIGGRTRPSLLYPILVAGLGGVWGTVLLGALIAVAIFFGVIEVVALIVGLGLSRSMTSSIANLYEGTQHVKTGDFGHRIAVQGNDQLAELQRSFNSMIEDIERLIVEQKEKERLQNELAIAQEVQNQLFPHEEVKLQSLEVHGVCRPARIVSGDYYDFVPMGAGRLGIAVGDISGKGISAALLMATVHSAVRAYEQLGHSGVPAALKHAAAADAASPAARNGHISPATTMAMLNRHLYQSTPLEKYATLFLGVYDESRAALTYSNAGHLPPFILRRDGTLSRLHEGGLVIGLFGDLKYEDRSIDLHPGDLFVAYSDGIVEPENEFGEFGEARLVELVREHRYLPLARIAEEVTQAVQDWIGSAEQPDDVTLVLARAR